VHFQSEALSELNRLYVQFEDFCRIGLQLVKGASELHKSQIKRFAKYFRQQPLKQVTTSDIRNYLKTFDGLGPYTYSNALKVLSGFSVGFN